MFAYSFGQENSARKKREREKKLSRAEEEKRSNISLSEFNGPPDGRGAIKSCGRN